MQYLEDAFNWSNYMPTVNITIAKRGFGIGCLKY